MPLTRSALGRAGKTTKRPKTGRPGRRTHATASMVQHARKRVADAQKAGAPALVRPSNAGDQGPSPFVEEAMRKRDEFSRTGTVTISEDGKTATLTRLTNGLRVRFVDRNGAAPQTLTFNSSDDGGRWFEANFPKHSRV